MRLYPEFDAFAETYKNGEPQAVWTRLVADLETPVSAMLKLGADKPMSFLLESVEGGAVRGRYSVLGFDPDIIWRARGDAAEINRTPGKSLSKFIPCEGGTLDGAARSARRIPDGAASQPAADGARRLRLYGLRHGAADRKAARAQSRPDRHSRRGADPPDGDGDLRQCEGRDLHRHAGAAGEAGDGENRLCPRGRPSVRHRRRAGRSAQPCGRPERRQPRFSESRPPTPRRGNTRRW